MSVTRVVVADGDPSLRFAIHAWLERDGGFEPVAVVETGAEALLSLVGADPAIDLLVLDLAIRDMEGLDVIRSALKIRPTLRVLVLTGYDVPLVARELALLGVTEHMQKGGSPIELIERLGQLGGEAAAVRTRP